jgi:hypothetical protein
MIRDYNRDFSALFGAWRRNFKAGLWAALRRLR